MKLLHILILFLSFLKVTAQYTITASQKPAIGDSNNFIKLDTNNIINGTSGANQIWNYTNLILPANPIANSIYYSNATAIPNYTWYPGAHMAIIAQDGGFTSYDSDPNNLSVNWLYSSIGGGSCTKYVDEFTKYHYPISYNSVFSDSAKFLAYDQHPPNPSNIGLYPEYGVYSYTCNGYGTLNLPNSVSYPNTLKLNGQYVKTYFDEITLAPAGNDTIYFEEYFNTISKFPILSFYKTDGHITIFNNTTSHHYKNIELNMVVLTDLKNQELASSDISIFPNPSSGLVYIKINYFTLPENPIFTLQSILSSQSIVKAQKTSNSNEDYYSIDLSDYSPGIYILTLKSEKGLVSKKILVQ